MACVHGLGHPTYLELPRLEDAPSYSGLGVARAETKAHPCMQPCFQQSMLPADFCPNECPRI
eukprot:1155321-Pelagomonas_calceolata.AAC.4